MTLAALKLAEFLCTYCIKKSRNSGIVLPKLYKLSESYLPPFQHPYDWGHG